MLPPVFALLKASVDVKHIVGTNPPRIWRHGRAPQDTAKPYITWFLVVGTPENNLSELPPTDRMTVQVDCWHQTDTGVDTLADAARDALEPAGHMTGVVVDERDTATGLYRMALQFDIFNPRTP